MSESSESSGAAKKVRKLADAVQRVRTAETERSDIVVELREAERARLDMLAEELKDFFAEVPEDNQTFLFTVATGTQPRLWIDMTAFVVMGRDRRTYRFLKDTRLGRTVIVESGKLADVATFSIKNAEVPDEEAEKAGAHPTTQIGWAPGATVLGRDADLAVGCSIAPPR